MSEPPAIHPLDTPDESLESTPLRLRAPKKASQPLLRFSVIALVLSFGITFLSAVAMGNAPPSSPSITLGRIINSLSTLGMLLACCGILLAYRLPLLKNDPARPRVPGLWRSGYMSLVLGNIVGLAVLTAAAWLLSGILPSQLFLLFWLYPLASAFFITMAIWHTGYLRAYAIGVLVVISMQLILWVPLLYSGFSGRNMGGAGQLNAVLFSSLIVVSVTGLLCAGYVRLLERFRS
ncbi:MAG: hypothetical protein KDA45_02135 [Planctomycetales bacterium]|nr:hypothetical protein [Planctomycetales bacterium]